MGQNCINITKVNCFMHGAENEANRFHTAQKNLNYIFEFRPISSSEIITKILPKFFADNNR